MIIPLALPPPGLSVPSELQLKYRPVLWGVICAQLGAAMCRLLAGDLWGAISDFMLVALGYFAVTDHQIIFTLWYGISCAFTTLFDAIHLGVRIYRLGGVANFFDLDQGLMFNLASFAILSATVTAFAGAMLCYIIWKDHERNQEEQMPLLGGGFDRMPGQGVRPGGTFAAGDFEGGGRQQGNFSAFAGPGHRLGGDAPAAPPAPGNHVEIPRLPLDASGVGAGSTNPWTSGAVAGSTGTLEPRSGPPSVAPMVSGDGFDAHLSVADNNTVKIVIYNSRELPAEPVNWPCFLEELQADRSGLRPLLLTVLSSNIPFKAFNLEFAPASLRGHADLEFVCIDAPNLQDIRADYRAFSQHLTAGEGQPDVCVFESPSKDATLVAPTWATTELQDYSNAGSFFRKNAPQEQKDKVLRELGRTVQQQLQRKDVQNVWVSTDGRVIPWMCMRVQTQAPPLNWQPYSQPRS